MVWCTFDANDFAKTENQILATNFGDAEKQWIFIPMFWYGLREFFNIQ